MIIGLSRSQGSSSGPLIFEEYRPERYESGRAIPAATGTQSSTGHKMERDGTKSGIGPGEWGRYFRPAFPQVTMGTDTTAGDGFALRAAE